MKYLSLVVLLIIFRHDNPDVLHQRIGEVFEPYLASLNLPDCEGAIIGEGWVLTAAHCAVVVGEKLRLSKHELIIMGVKHPVEQVITHPKFENDIRYDLALIKFKTKRIIGYQIASINSDKQEEGKEVYLVGHGATGNGRWPWLSNDDKLRGGTNRVSSVSEHWIQMKFDKPSSPDATEFECISGPGDSGGPAFILENDVVYLAGLSSWQSTEETYGINHVYGVTEFYTRISSYHDWICMYIP